jgi:hypothetical protein
MLFLHLCSYWYHFSRPPFPDVFVLNVQEQSELGQVHILVVVSMLSWYLAKPREGQLQQVFHTFGYLKWHERPTMVSDDTKPWFNPSQFHECDWSEFYPDAEDALPPNMPEPRGKEVSTAICDFPRENEELQLEQELSRQGNSKIGTT